MPLVESVTLICSSDQFNLLPFGLTEIQNGSINQSSKNTKSRPEASQKALCTIKGENQQIFHTFVYLFFRSN